MQRFKNILYVAESEQQQKVALERAVTLSENNQARLTVVAMTPGIRSYIGLPGSINPAKLQSAVADDSLEQLDSLVEPYRKRIKIETKVLQGTAFLEIVREVIRNQHDLVIKNPDHQDFLDRLFGSNDMHLLRKCPCPVWIIKPQAPKTYRRILAAIDLDDFYPPQEASARRKLNHHILEMASSLALADFAELHIAHAWDAPGESVMRRAYLRSPEEQLAVYVEQIRQQHARSLKSLLREISAKSKGKALEYLEPQMHLLKGWARKEIPSLARQIDADLVVMGTVARTGVPGLVMGNTAETILNLIDCSVLAIKPPGFETPVTLED